MAKTKTAVSGNPFGKKLLNSLKKYWFVWIVGIGLVGVFGIYRPVSVYLDKQRFLRAEKEIEEVAEQIQAKIGPADQIVKDSSCDRPNLKSGRGKLKCHVGIDLLYENRDTAQSNLLIQNLLPFGQGNIAPDLSETTASGFTENNSLQRFVQDRMTATDLSCNLYYSHRVGSDPYENVSPVSAENFMVSISCGGIAKSELFEIR